jgi:hypothetical protein
LNWNLKSHFIRHAEDAVMGAIAPRYSSTICFRTESSDRAEPARGLESHRRTCSRRGWAQALLLAAIGALAGIRPEDALELLKDLADSDDETIAMSKAFPEEEEEEGIWTGKID